MYTVHHLLRGVRYCSRGVSRVFPVFPPLFVFFRFAVSIFSSSLRDRLYSKLFSQIFIFIHLRICSVLELLSLSFRTNSSEATMAIVEQLEAGRRGRPGASVPMQASLDRFKISGWPRWDKRAEGGVGGVLIADAARVKGRNLGLPCKRLQLDSCTRLFACPDANARSSYLLPAALLSGNDAADVKSQGNENGAASKSGAAAAAEEANGKGKTTMPTTRVTLVPKAE